MSVEWKNGLAAGQSGAVSRRAWLTHGVCLSVAGRVLPLLGGGALTAALAGCDRAADGAGGAGNAGGVAGTSAAPALGRFKGIDVTGAPYGKGFALTDMHGQPRTLADFKGQVVMLYFGFVQCPDVCPTALTRASQVMQQLGPELAARVQVIFVTVDPERDTPELLKTYMANFDPAFLALRGSPEQLAAVAKDFKVYYKKAEGATPEIYSMDHSAGSYIFDPAGRLRVYSRYGIGVPAVTADVQALIQEAG